MSKTISIRADESLCKSLEDRATASGRTVSELVREILEDALTDRPLETRTGHLKGRLTLPRDNSNIWRTRLRQRNWRP